MTVGGLRLRVRISGSEVRQPLDQRLPHLDVSAQGPSRAGRVALALALLSTPYRYYSRAHLKAIAPRLYGGRIARQPELLDRDAYARLGHAPSWRGYAWQLAAIAGWSSLPFLRRIRVPTLVLTGDDDPIIRVWNGLLWVLLATAGLRVGEALELRWEDVDLDARRLAVKRTLQQRRGVGLVRVKPKTPRSRRGVPR